MWWSTPSPGDWVKTDKEIKSTLGDYLTGTGVARGTRGVVIERIGSRALVEFGTGLGSFRVNVPFHDLTFVRRSGGVDNFRTHARRMSIIRLAIVGFLLFPVFQFAAVFVWHRHTLEGIVPAFAEAALWSIGDWTEMFLGHPVQMLIYCGFLWALGKFAFRH